MKKELFEELLQSVKEAAAIERGKMKPLRTFKVKTANDVVRVQKNRPRQKRAERNRFGVWKKSGSSF